MDLDSIGDANPELRRKSLDHIQGEAEGRMVDNSRKEKSSAEVAAKMQGQGLFQRESHTR